MAHVHYCLDLETTGLDEKENEIIEMSVIRLSDDSQKTWLLQPTKFETVQDDALRVNGHKLQDLKNGYRILESGDKEFYLTPNKAIIEIEKFLFEDLATSSERVPVGQNVQFDIRFLKELWKGCGQPDTYPFGRMYLDTMQIASFLDYVTGEERQSYHLGGLVKDYGIKKEKAHRADSDTRMTKELFLKLAEKARAISK